LKLSVVIVTWNSAADIAACIESINFGPQLDIIVVDNGSSDATREKLSQYPHLKVITNRTNLGYARANNQGFRLAAGEYILLLNPDTRLEPGCLDVLSGYLDSHPDVGAVAPRLLNPDGSTQLSIRSFPGVGSVLSELSGLSRLFPGSSLFDRWRLRRFDYDQESVVEQPMASCLLVRRQVLDQLGGFDESFPMFYNDVDLSYRMKQAGWKTVYLPTARVYHRLGASTSQVKTKMVWESHRALFRYLLKHDPSPLFWLKAVILLPLLELAGLVRVLAYRLTRFRR